MARIPYLDFNDMPDDIRAHFAKLPPMNLFRLLLHAPGDAVAITNLGVSTLTGQELPSRLRELAVLRVTHVLGCQVQRLQHVNVARAHGLSDEHVAEVARWTTSDAFGQLERKMLQFTDEVTRTGTASQETFDALHEHLDDRQILELTIAVTFNGMLCRIQNTFGVEPEAGAGSYSTDSLPRG